jgi:hypothetical protein
MKAKRQNRAMSVSGTMSDEWSTSDAGQRARERAVAESYRGAMKHLLPNCTDALACPAFLIR